MPLSKEEADAALILLMGLREEFQRRTGRKLDHEKHLPKGQTRWTIREIAHAMGAAAKEAGQEDLGNQLVKLV